MARAPLLVLFLALLDAVAPFSAIAPTLKLSRPRNRVRIESDPLGRLGKIAANRAKDVKFSGGINPAFSGAVVGGVLLGPLGLLGGLAMGAAAKERQDAENELKKLGLDKEFVVEAQRLASLLEEALAAEEAAHTSADGLAARLRATNDDADRLYASAKECLEANDDDGARKNLEAKNALLARVPALEAEMEQANGRLSSSRRSAEVLKAKIAEVDAIVRRAAASAAAQGGGGEGSAFVAEDYDSYVEPPPGRSADPLLARFEALEREGRKKV